MADTELVDRDRDEGAAGSARESRLELKMMLEADKCKIEDDLEAERTLAVDKDVLLERSQQAAEDKYENLREAFEQVAEDLVHLEQGEKSWFTRKHELAEELGQAQEEIQALHGDIADIQKVSEELRTLAVQCEEDLMRTKKCMETS
ncbi:hypothetical protein BJ912DRAFT_1060826 [Pholiota molesta]|nr:hypothetical protein BJ912DRAFT_1060826 [Pholiota molesta]